MNLASFALKDAWRRPTRTLLTGLGVAVAALCLFTVLSFDRGYDRALREEMARSGAHLYVSTEGCPLEAATLILQGGEIPRFLRDHTLDAIAQVPGVRAAAPMLMFAAPSAPGKLDLFSGFDPRLADLRPYWSLQGKWPEGTDEILLGSEAAEVRRRKVGDRIHFASIDREFTVAGVLERTGTQDDGLYFVSLPALQEIFHKPRQLTAVAVALRDVNELAKVEARIKERLPDVYVVTERQMTDEIVRLTGGSKTLMYSIVIIAVLVSVLGVLNTVLMSVFEKLREFGYMRCVGATRWDIFKLVAVETTVVCAGGAVAGVLAGAALSSLSDRFVRTLLPYSPAGSLMSFDWGLAASAIALTVLVGVLAGLLPGLKAARVAPMEVVRYE